MRSPDAKPGSVTMIGQPPVPWAVSRNREFGTQAIIGVQDILRVCLINSDKASITIISMVKYRTVAELFGAVVLRSNEDYRIGSGVLFHELALSDTKSSVNSVTPCRARINGGVDTTIAASVDDLVIRWIKREAVIIRMERTTN